MRERLFDEICPYVREAGLQHQDSWRSAARRIYDHQFFYCYTGRAHLTLDTRQYTLNSGSLAIIPPNVAHRFWVDEADPGELYWFHCDFFFFEDRKWIYELYNDPQRYIGLFGGALLYPEHIRENPTFEKGYRLPEFLVVEDRDAVEYLFRGICKAYNRHDRFWQLMARSLVLELLDGIFSQTLHQRNPAAHHRHLAGQMKRFVSANYYRPITVKDICNETGLNCEYASKLFKKETGMKPVEYLNRFRIGRAKRLLLEPDLSIADIAEMVGYSSAAYFCTVIKKYEGHTPDSLRDSLAEFLAEE